MTADAEVVLSPPLVERLREHFVLEWRRGLHGVQHWGRVRRNGLLLAERTGASRRVVSLFAFLHDSCRWSDRNDAEHGPRAAAFVEQLRDDALVSLSDEEAQLLAFACRHHSEGMLDADVTIQTCWDADRLDLGRVGIRPDPRLLCTPAARDRKLIAWAHARSTRTRGWV